MKWNFKPKARETDPETSHLAAESVYRPSRTAVNVFELLLDQNMTDEQLVYAWGERATVNPSFGYASPSSIRSRRAELVDAGYVVQSGWSTTRFGRKCGIWSVVNPNVRPSREQV